MQVQGGYIVGGVDEATGVPEVSGLTDDHARLLDEARLRNAVVKYLPEPLDLAVQHHDVDGKRVVLVYVGPNPNGCAVFKADGQYPKSERKGVTTVFRAGDIFTRRGTSSVRMQHADIHALIQRNHAVAADGPDLTLEMSGDEFVAALQRILARGEEVRIRVALGGLSRAAAEAVQVGDINRLGLVADRVTDATAVALTLDAEDALQRAVRTLTGIYSLGFSGDRARVEPIAGPVIWNAVLERVRGLGALAVREQKWSAIPTLVLQQVGRGYEDRHYANWLRHGDVMAARARLFADANNPRTQKSLLVMAKERAATLPSLTPDVLADDDALLSSLCQFDFLSCLVAVHAAREVGPRVCYPDFGRFYVQRVEPVAVGLLGDGRMREVLFPEDDQELADVLRALSRFAASAGHELGIFSWDGFEYGPVRDFLDRFPPRELA